MGTRIIQIGVLPDGVFAALTAMGYEVDRCGTAMPDLKRTLEQQHQIDAIAVGKNGAAKAQGILKAFRSRGKVPLILFQGENQRGDPSQFDLVIPEGASLRQLLLKVVAVIERSRALRARSRALGERFHSLLGESASLHEQSVRTRVETQRILAKRRRSGTERVSIPCVLVVDDNAQWRDAMCSLLEDHADCELLYQAANGIEAVQLAIELEPDLILLDVEMPALNGIEAARQIARCGLRSTMLFVSMNDCAAVVSEALSTGAKGYVLKTEAGAELGPAIEAVLQNEQYLSLSLRRLHSALIN